MEYFPICHELNEMMLVSVYRPAVSKIQDKYISALQNGADYYLKYFGQVA